MTATNKKFLECEHRTTLGIKHCSECDVYFECEEQHNNSFEEWNYEPQPFIKDELFETIGRIFAPANLVLTEELQT
jgi:arsenate reductase-like glutaredoxin family protein